MALVSSYPKHFLSDKVEHFTESVIREMTRQAMQHGAVNLAQGFPDFSAPAAVKQAAQQAIAEDVNQYAITWGAKNLRNAIAPDEGMARAGCRSRTRDRGLLRLDRGDDCHAAGRLQQGR